MFASKLSCCAGKIVNITVRPFLGFLFGKFGSCCISSLLFLGIVWPSPQRRDTHAATNNCNRPRPHVPGLTDPIRLERPAWWIIKTYSCPYPLVANLLIAQDINITSTRMERTHINILNINMDGIRKKHKRLALSQILTEQEIDICVITETHLRKNDLKFRWFEQMHISLCR